MDSLTHIVAGAALGELMLGKKIGNKAMIAGAIANTIPDLDVFFVKNASTPEMALQIHRSYTHALFTHPFLALPCALLAYRIFKKEIAYGTWYLLFLTGFVTHVLMDCSTTYGTQLFLPFTRQLISWNNLSVVDPLFTLPLLIFFFVLLFLRKENPLRRKLALAGIVISLAYLTSSTIFKFRSAEVFKKELSAQHLHYTGFSTTPTMFTSWLWNTIAYDDSTMYLGEYSVFQHSQKVNFVKVDRHTDLLKGMDSTPAVRTLQWFSQGNYFVEKGNGDTLQFYVTKWGRGDLTSTQTDKMFPFYSKIYRDHDGRTTFKQIEPDFKGRDFSRYFSMINQRIFHHD